MKRKSEYSLELTNAKGIKYVPVLEFSNTYGILMLSSNGYHFTPIAERSSKFIYIILFLSSLICCAALAYIYIDNFYIISACCGLIFTLLLIIPGIIHGIEKTKRERKIKKIIAETEKQIDSNLINVTDWIEARGIEISPFQNRYYNIQINKGSKDSFKGSILGRNGSEQPNDILNMISEIASWAGYNT